MDDKDKTKQQLIREITELRKKCVDHNLTDKIISSDETIYKNIVEDQTEFIVRWLPGGIRTFVNESYCRYFGISREEAIGSSFFQPISGEDRNAVESKIAALTPENPVVIGEHRVIRTDGTIGWNRWSDRAIFDENGRIIEFQSIGIDVTERKRAEEKVLEKQKQLDTFLSNVDAIVLEGDPFNIYYVGGSVEKLLGYPVEKWFEDPDGPTGFWSKHLHPDDKHKAEICGNAIAEGENHSFEYRMLAADGSIVWFYDSVTVETNQGVPVIARSIMVDITDRKRAEEALKDSEEKYRSLVERANDGIIIAQDGMAKFVNTRMAEIFGYTVDEVVNTPFIYYVFPSERPRISELYKKRLRGEKIPDIYEMIGLHKSGKKITIEINSGLITYEGDPAIMSFIRDITERKLAREAMEKERAFTETALNSQIDTFFVFDPSSRKPIRWNKAFRDISGYTDEEIASMKAPDDWYDSEDLKRAAISMERLLKGEQVTFEMMFITKGGDRIPTEYTASAFQDIDSKQQYIIAIGRDLTDRKQGEDALRESEEKYRSFVDRANDGIAITQNKKIKFANPSLAKMFGYEVEELINSPFLNYISPDDRPRVIEIYTKRLQGEDVPIVYEFAAQHKDGEVINIEINSGIINYNGERAILSFFRDITERKRAEEALQESEGKYRSLITNIPDVVWTSDENGNTSFISDNIEKIYGYTPEEIYRDGDRLWFGRICPDDIDNVKNSYKALLEGKQHFNVEYRVKKKDGSWIWLHDRALKTRDEYGKIRVDGVFSDITSRKKAEKALKESFEIINKSPAVAFLWKNTENWPVEYVSENVKNLYGYSAEDFMSGKVSYSEIVHPEDLERVGGEVTRNSMDKERADFVHEPYRIITEDGQVRWVDDRTNIRRNEKGEITHYQGIVQDITERKRLEDSIRNLAEVDSAKFGKEFFENIVLRLSKTLQADFTLIGELRSDGRESIRTIAVSADGEISDNFEYDLANTPCASVVGQEVCSYPAGVADQFPEDELLKQMGIEGYIGVPLFDSRGSALGIMVALFRKPLRHTGFGESILRIFSTRTGSELERMRAEEALKNSLQVSDDIVRTIPSGIYIYDYIPPDRLILINANKTAEEITGVKLDEWKGKEFNEIWPNAKAQGITDKYLEVVRTGVTYESDDLVYSDEKLNAAFRVRSFTIPGNRLVSAFEDITNKKKAEHALKENEEKYRNLVETSQDLIWRCDAEGRFIFLNNAWEKTLGYKIAEMMNRPFSEFQTKEVAERDVKEFSRHMAGGFVSGYETTQIAKSGKEIHLVFNAIPIYDDSRKIIGTQGTAHDITERKHAEDNLRESEKRFRAMLENNPLSAVVLDTEGRITFCNDSLLDLTGWNRDEVIGKDWFEYFIIENEYDVVKPVFQKMIRDRDFPSQFENHIKTKTGETRLIAWQNTALRDSQRRIISIASLGEDITERRRMSEALQNSEERYRRLSSATFEGIVYSEAGKILDTNKQFASMFGYKKEELLGIPVSGLVYPEDRDLVKQRISEEYEEPYEHRAVRKDGSIIYVEVRGRMAKKEDLKVRITAIRDVTSRKQAEEALRNAMTVVEQLKTRFQAENIYLQEEIKIEHNFDQIIGRSKKLKDVLRQVEQVASSNATVLVLGETGTGKELIARAIHGISDRKDRPLVKVNIAALPANLIESELFGYEKGAFTGAVSRRIGRFELADGGTILLDEIGDLPIELQVKLLRVLQEGEFERLGGIKTMKVDVRIIAATNRDLEKAVETGQFREDLYHRLNVFPIIIPPLRERKEDIPPLVNHLAIKFGKKAGKKIEKLPKKVLDTLVAYDWPGNVRGLENIIERSVLMSRGDQLVFGELLTKSAASSGTSRIPTLTAVEKGHILNALDSTGWRVSGDKGAAKILGINPKTLEARMRKLNIKRPGR